RTQPSARAASQEIENRRHYLPTIFPYRGDLWGTSSQVTYLNHQHFASAIRILLLVLVFLVIRYRAVAAKRAEERASETMIRRPNGLPETAPISSSGNPNQLEHVRRSQTNTASA